MITFTPFSYEKHGLWAKKLLDVIYAEDTKGIVALRNNKPVGVMLGDNWTAETVQTHVGVTDPLVFKHGLHKEFANWVFGVCGRSAMLGFVPASNEKAIKIDKHFGFKEEYRIKDGYKKGVDVIIFRLDWYDCPYYEAEKFRKVA